MIWNYFKIAWRTLIKNKVYSVITILGLTIGIWACMSVATVVMDDLSYDHHWTKGNDLYRVLTVRKSGINLYDRSASSLSGINTALTENFPEVEAVSDFHTREIYLKTRHESDGIKMNILYADTTIWKLLDLKFLRGNPQNYVHGKINLIISESIKNALFPDQDPVGTTIIDVPAYGEQANEYIITGIIKDIPSNTHLRADAIIVQKGRMEALSKEQFGFFQQYYALMKPGTNMPEFTDKFNAWYSQYVEVDNPDFFEFQPIKEVYLHSDFAESQAVQGSFRNIYIFLGVAFLLLIIACVNFINLSTARAVQRLREVGVRKILGAGRRQLIFQFLTESLLFFLISAFIASFLYTISLPLIENYLSHRLELTFASDYYFITAGFIALLIISLLTGGYPAVIISGFKPATTLKGNLYSGRLTGQNLMRKSLVILQFSISIVVLIALIIVQQQVSFMKNKDIGFETKGLLSIGFVSWDGKGESFKNELLRKIGVQNASITSWIPTKGAGNMSRIIEDPNNPGKNLTVWYINADADLIKTLGLKLEKGRFLADNFSSDLIINDHNNMMTGEKRDSVGHQSSLITSKTAKLLQINSLNEQVENLDVTPVGIVNDFNNESLKTNIKLTIIKAEKSPQYGGMLIRVKPGTEEIVTENIQQLWNQFYPNKLLNINQVEDLVNQQYLAESKLQQLFAFFSGLSMFLACIGIFGLIVQITEQRVKEIGIRKVLGASVNSITLLFSKDFLKIVIISIVIASPIAAYLMQKWLQDFSYRIELSVWVFVLAGSSAIVVALLTVSIQVIKAATSNPIKNLRTE